MEDALTPQPARSLQDRVADFERRIEPLSPTLQQVRETADHAAGRQMPARDSGASSQAASGGGDPLETVGARLGFVEAPAERLLAQAGWLRHDAGGLPRVTAWSSPSGMIVLAVAVAGADVVRDIGHAARLRDAALVAFGATPREHVTCLFVTQGPSDPRAVDRAVVVRRVARDVRVISSDALATLASLVAGGALPHARAVDLLRPAGASADETVFMLADRQLRHGEPAAPAGTMLDCPQCRASVVRAALAAADLGGDLVFLHCRQCGHVWTMKDRRAAS